MGITMDLSKYEAKISEEVLLPEPGIPTTPTMKGRLVRFVVRRLARIFLAALGSQLIVTLAIVAVAGFMYSEADMSARSFIQ